MDKVYLSETARALVAPAKGILAADESMGTIEKRFDKINVDNTEVNRLAYRQMLFTTPDIEKYLSGVILFDETVWQDTPDGQKLHDILSQRGILPGIKVDEGKDPGGVDNKEFLTKGLEKLAERLPNYKNHGLHFTKWRAAFNISENTPSEEIIFENARRLAEYAFICQENNLVPIVEPEVVMDGSHSTERCEEVTIQVQTAVFSELEKRGVYLEGMLLKPNMVVQGKDLGDNSAHDVATKTLRVLTKCVHPLVPGIVFLSGGLSPEIATLFLNEINKNKKESPWELSFSFGRALQSPALEIWQGKVENVEAAQKAFLKRARLTSLAREGKYDPALEVE
jgi:fructose-bisphosphate aldolase class I